jgi:hypothetical protein
MVLKFHDLMYKEDTMNENSQERRSSGFRIDLFLALLALTLQTAAPPAPGAEAGRETGAPKPPGDDGTPATSNVPGARMADVALGPARFRAPAFPEHRALNGAHA